MLKQEKSKKLLRSKLNKVIVHNNLTKKSSIEFDEGLIKNLTEEELNMLADDPYYYVSCTDSLVRSKLGKFGKRNSLSPSSSTTSFELFRNFLKKYTTDFEHSIYEMFEMEKQRIKKEEKELQKMIEENSHNDPTKLMASPKSMKKLIFKQKYDHEKMLRNLELKWKRSVDICN